MAGRERTPEPPRRVTVRYEGMVQGVWFRFTALRLAERFDVAGFVRNEPDGAVSLVAEGSEQDLAGLIIALKSSHLGRYITGERVSWSAGTGEFTSFSVAYS